MSDSHSYKEIAEVKSKIINYILIIGSTLGAIAYFISLIEVSQIGFRFNQVTDFVAISVMVIVAIFRKKIDIKYRSLAIIVGLFTFIFADAYVLGLYATNKMLLIAIPIFSMLVYDFKRVIIIFSIGIFGFLFLGYLHMSGIVVSDTDHLSRSLNPIPWVVAVLIITILSLIIVIVFHQFNLAFTKLINNLKVKNSEIADREQNYREIFDSSTDAIFIHDMQGRILDVNEAMLKMYEYDNIESIDLGKLSSEEGEFTSEESWNHLQKAMRDGVNVFDWQAKKNSGKLFWVEVALKKVHILGDERILAIVRDIDEKKKISIQLNDYKTKLEYLVKERTEELEAANEKMKSANEELYGQRSELESALTELQAAQKQLMSAEKMSSLGVLAVGVAHEINNPLNFIQGGVFGLEAILFDEDVNIKNNNEDVKKLLDAIKEGVERASSIVASLSLLSNQESSSKKECNIHNVIDNCLVVLKNTDKGIEVIKDYAAISPTLVGNNSKLHQAFLNIISNAIQSIKNEGKVEIRTETKGDKLSICIKDTGVGISEENISKIADPFFTTKAPGKGTGLGLSITYNIIEEHLGSIEYKSEVNVGTTAIVVLPLY